MTNVIRDNEAALEALLAEAVEPMGFQVTAPGLSDQSNRVSVAWRGVSDSRVAWEIEVILAEREFGSPLAESFVACWNAVAESQAFTGVATSVRVAYKEIPTGGTKPKNYTTFTVLGANIDARGV